MKKLLLIVLFSIPAMAQDGFKAQGREIIWEKTFPVNNADVVALLDRQPELKVSSFIDNAYKGSVREISNTCEGGSGLMKNNCKFDFIVLVNPDHYVVVVRNLKLLEKYGPMQARTIANRCEKYFLYNRALKDDEKSVNDLSCLDNFLTGIFSVQQSASLGTASN
jgi:hypothetical protein